MSYQESLNIFFSIFKLQITLYLQQFTQLCESLAYLFFAVIIFHLALSSTPLPLSVGIGILLCLHLFTILLIVEDFLIVEYKTTFLEQLHLLGMDLMLIILAKYLSLVLFINFIVLLVLPINMLLLAIPITYYPLLAVILCLFLSLAILFTMLAAIINIDGRSKFTLSLITMLLILPALLIANLSITIPNYIWLLVAQLLFFLPIVLLVAKHMLLVAFNQGARRYEAF